MSDINTALSPWVRVFTGAALIVLIVGPLLLFAPQVITLYWPWAITPFSARFLGAVYLAEFLSLGVLFLDNRWSPGRAAFAVAFVFTFVVSVASIIHLSSFIGVNRVILWFVLYVGYAALTLGALLLHRGLPSVPPLAVDPRLSKIIQIAAALLVFYGSAMFVSPTAAAGFWPWTIEPMHGRIYSAVFLAPGIGLLLLIRSAAAEEYRVGGVFLASLGPFAILSLVLAQLQTGRAIYANPGTWAWIALFVVIGVLGALMIKASRARL